MATILRHLPTASLADWEANKPRLHMVAHHLDRIVDTAPDGWKNAIRARFPKGDAVCPFPEGTQEHAQWVVSQPPDWVRAWDKLQDLAKFDDAYGDAARLNLSDYEICAWAKRLAAEVDEFMDGCELSGFNLADRGHALRMMLGTTGALSPEDVADLFKLKRNPSQALVRQKIESAIKRTCDDAWWRRKLRRLVARVVEAGAIRLGLVNVAKGRYISQGGLLRRQAQIERNAEALARRLYRNEAGQVYALSELAALGTANPAIRGGELMTRIRGAEEYADSHGHVGLFITLTLPSKFHPVTFRSSKWVKGKRKDPAPQKGQTGLDDSWGEYGEDEATRAARQDSVRTSKPRHNKKYNGATPRDGQQWLCETWAKVRAKLDRMGLKIYGLRVAEPHHDGTPHWHALLWTEGNCEAIALAMILRKYWLEEDGDEKGARENRVCIKRMETGGAAGYVAKYIAKSVGHIALAEHQDLVNGEQIRMEYGPEESQGFQRVDAWAACWGIRQFQTIGMPSVTAWRELRRVSGDQLELFGIEGDRATKRAHTACHREGERRADWHQFMEAMGGHALKRKDWHLRTVHRMMVDGQVNKYGEKIEIGRIVGLTPQHGRMAGRWLVSRRIAWVPVAAESSTHAAHSFDAENGDAAEQAQGTGTAQSRDPQDRAWTGFNNCTARITHGLRRALFGRGDHEMSDWATPETVAHFRALRQMEAQQ